MEDENISLQWWKSSIHSYGIWKCYSEDWIARNEEWHATLPESNFGQVKMSELGYTGKNTTSTM
jgi:hypothetical protein